MSPGAYTPLKDILLKQKMNTIKISWRGVRSLEYTQDMSDLE